MCVSSPTPLIKCSALWCSLSQLQSFNRLSQMSLKKSQQLTSYSFVYPGVKVNFKSTEVMCNINDKYYHPVAVSFHCPVQFQSPYIAFPKSYDLWLELGDMTPNQYHDFYKLLPRLGLINNYFTPPPCLRRITGRQLTLLLCSFLITHT